MPLILLLAIFVLLGTIARNKAQLRLFARKDLGTLRQAPQTVRSALLGASVTKTTPPRPSRARLVSSARVEMPSLKRIPAQLGHIQAISLNSTSLRNAHNVLPGTTATNQVSPSQVVLALQDTTAQTAQTLRLQTIQNAETIFALEDLTALRSHLLQQSVHPEPLATRLKGPSFPTVIVAYQAPIATILASSSLLGCANQAIIALVGPQFPRQRTTLVILSASRSVIFVLQDITVLLEATSL